MRSVIETDHFWKDTRFNVLGLVPLSVDRKKGIFVELRLNFSFFFEVFIVFSFNIKNVRLSYDLFRLSPSCLQDVFRLRHELLGGLDSGSKLPALSLDIVNWQVSPHLTSVSKVVPSFHIRQKSCHTNLASMLPTKYYQIIVTIINFREWRDILI